MHGRDLIHNKYSTRMIPSINDTHRLVQHTLHFMEMAWTDDSTLAIFFYMCYTSSLHCITLLWEEVGVTQAPRVR